MENLQLSFRAAVGKHFRVYLKECCDEGYPLKNASRVVDKDGIIELIKLFDKYENIDTIVDALNEADTRYKTYKKAIQFKQISAPANITEYKKNSKEIHKLNAKIIDIAEKSSLGLLELDSFKAKLLAETKTKLSRLYRQRTRLKSKRMRFEDEQTKIPLEKDFSSLLYYFPDANVKLLSEVEEFHKGVSKAIESEYKKKCKEIDDLLSLNAIEIENVEEKIKSMGAGQNVSKMILDSYAEKKQRHDNLIEANKHFDSEKGLKDSIEDLKKQLKQLLSKELLAIESQINSQMAEYNQFVYNAEKSTPVLKLKDESHYSFYTPNDSGTGSRYKGLILFDLAILNQTPLPATVHDSFMLKQIEDTVLEKLFELYSSTTKQTFIAIDKLNSYTERAAELLEKSVVLRLTPNGNELFGRSWNIAKKDEYVN